MCLQAGKQTSTAAEFYVLITLFCAQESWRHVGMLCLTRGTSPYQLQQAHTDGDNVHLLLNAHNTYKTIHKGGSVLAGAVAAAALQLTVAALTLAVALAC
jgi:hypothetical protein